MPDGVRADAWLWVRHRLQLLRRGLAVAFGPAPEATEEAPPRDPRLAGAPPALAEYVASHEPVWFELGVGADSEEPTTPEPTSSDTGATAGGPARTGRAGARRPQATEPPPKGGSEPDPDLPGRLEGPRQSPARDRAPDRNSNGTTPAPARVGFRRLRGQAMDAEAPAADEVAAGSAHTVDDHADTIHAGAERTSRDHGGAPGRQAQAWEPPAAHPRHEPPAWPPAPEPTAPRPMRHSADRGQLESRLPWPRPGAPVGGPLPNVGGARRAELPLAEMIPPGPPSRPVQGVEALQRPVNANVTPAPWPELPQPLHDRAADRGSGWPGSTTSVTDPRADALAAEQRRV